MHLAFCRRGCSCPLGNHVRGRKWSSRGAWKCPRLIPGCGVERWPVARVPREGGVVEVPSRGPQAGGDQSGSRWDVDDRSATIMRHSLGVEKFSAQVLE